MQKHCQIPEHQTGTCYSWRIGETNSFVQQRSSKSIRYEWSFGAWCGRDDWHRDLAERIPVTATRAPNVLISVNTTITPRNPHNENINPYPYVSRGYWNKTANSVSTILSVFKELDFFILAPFPVIAGVFPPPPWRNGKRLLQGKTWKLAQTDHWQFVQTRYKRSRCHKNITPAKTDRPVNFLGKQKRQEDQTAYLRSTANIYHFWIWAAVLLHGLLLDISYHSIRTQRHWNQSHTWNLKIS